MDKINKRLVFCFDGTWNRLDAPNPTNVVLTAESVLPLARNGTAQVIYYDQGVGTGKYDRISGGVFGAGVTDNLADAYRHLIFNHTPGDEIYIFGFSRGAYTARSFAGLIGVCGIVERSQAAHVADAISLYRSRTSSHPPTDEDIAKFRAEMSQRVCVSRDEDRWRCQHVDGYVSGAAPLINIAYIGVWDTVGALGIPQRYKLLGFLNQDTRFHDTRLGPIVHSGRHAVAVDESRRDFEPTLWTALDQRNRAAGARPEDDDAPYQQKWFPGVHGSVGGGGDFRGLSDLALEWIWDGARLAGLALDTDKSSRVYSLVPDFFAPLDNVDASKRTRMQRIKDSVTNTLWRRAPRTKGPDTLDGVSVCARRRWHARPESLPEKTLYRPMTLKPAASRLDADTSYTKPMPQPSPGTFEVIVVRKGDSLSKISHDRFGTIRYVGIIFEMNRDKLENPDRIYTGMSLRIPVLPKVPAPADPA